MAVFMPAWIDWIVKAFLNEMRSAPVTLTLALVAILFAVIQFFDSVHVKSKMRGVIQKENDLVQKTEAVTISIEKVSGRINAVAKSMEDIERSLSSRFVGTFPKHIKTINEVMSRTDRVLLILKDWVSYGEYSTPKEYDEYKRQLRDIRINKSGPPRVCILVYDKDRLREQLAEQFPEKDFANESTTERFKQYFLRHHPSRPIPKDHTEFTRVALEIEEEQRKELRDVGVEIQELNKPSLMFLWLEDGEDAVFCFQTRGGTQQGLSFRTRDIGLISSLYGLFSANWKGMAIPLLPHQMQLEVHSPISPAKA